MNRVVVILLSVVLVAACGPTGVTSAPTVKPKTNPPRTATPTATPTPASAAFLATRSRLDYVLNGGVTQPFVLDWPSISKGAALSKRQSTAFCGALDTPYLDDVLASVVAVAVNALWLKLRKRPAPEETEDYLNIAAKFVVKSCQGWAPLVLPPTATPPPAAPDVYSFTPMKADPDVSWRFLRPTEQSCRAPLNCWKIAVFARAGCPTSLSVVLAILDASNALLDTQTKTYGPVGKGKTLTTAQFLTSDTTAKWGRVTYITCR
jgi:hypothetical protein